MISDNEIIERAEYIVNIAKDNNKESIISIFENISLPFSGDNLKKDLFLKIFELANIDSEWHKDLGFIILSEKRTMKTVVSHMDLIPSFNKGFKNKKIYKIKDEKIIGALDNTFTNAILISSILNNRNEEITYLFTKDEETNQNAIKKYMKMYGKEQFIINMDVTNDGTDHNMSIEYDEPSWNICKQMNDNLENPFFTTEREGDDLDQVLNANGFGFSYCIPTKNTIHSYNNSTELSKIEPYMNGLEFLIHRLDTSIKAQDINYMTIDNSLRHKTFNKMKEKDVYNSVENKKIKSNSLIENNFIIGNNIAKDLLLNETSDKKEYKRFIKVLKKICTTKYPGYSENLEKFLDYTIGMADTFKVDELELFLPKDFYYEMLSMKLLRQSSFSYNEFELSLTKTSKFKILLVLLKYTNINSLNFYKELIEYNVDSFEYERLRLAENNKKAQNINEAITELLRKGLIKKEKNNSKFKILKGE